MATPKAEAKAKKSNKVSADTLNATAEKVKAEKRKSDSDALTTKAVVKKITEKKDLMYIYPEDVDTIEKRKSFRTKSRAALKRFTKALDVALKSKDEKAIEAATKDLRRFKKATYTPEKVES